MTEFAPVSTLPKNASVGARQSAEIINAEIERRTYNVAEFTKAIECDPSNSLAWYNRGKAYVEAKDYSEAVKDFTEAIRLGHFASYNARGVAYSFIKQNTKALSDFDAVIDKNRKATGSSDVLLLAKALLNKALTLDEMQQPEISFAICDQIIARFIDSTDPSIEEVVAGAFLGKGKYYSESKTTFILEMVTCRVW
jgi:tetratricopeptide (TPR) repeat protein